MNLTPEQQFHGLLSEITDKPSQDALRAEFVFDDDMCAIIRLDAAAQTVLVEIFALDLSFHTGLARDVLMEGILQCNTIGTLGRPFFVGVDERDFVLVCNRLPLAGLDSPRILDELDYLLEQSRAILDFLELLALGILPGAAETPVSADGPRPV